LKKFIFFSLSLLLIATILSCSSSEENFPRPNSIPQEAMWIGGIDGGAWVLLSKDDTQPKHIYNAEIYGDQAGDLWYSGRLQLDPKEGESFDIKNPDNFGVWDGDNLLLQDGRTLKGIDDFDPYK